MFWSILAWKILVCSSNIFEICHARWSKIYFGNLAGYYGGQRFRIFSKAKIFLRKLQKNAEKIFGQSGDYLKNFNEKMQYIQIFQKKTIPYPVASTHSLHPALQKSGRKNFLSKKGTFRKISMQKCNKKRFFEKLPL